MRDSCVRFAHESCAPVAYTYRTECIVYIDEAFGAQRYVQYVNRRHGRSGTLWEGRFYSCVVEEESYLLRCYRYIELNPVRAQLVRHPRDYRWSSYRCNAEGEHSEMISPHALYRGLGKSYKTREAAYRALFDDDLDSTSLDAIRYATNGNFALGSERFRQQVESRLSRRASPGKPGRPRKTGVRPRLPSYAKDPEIVV